MDNGWIKLYRKIMDKGYYKKSDYKSVWFHILLKANHKDNEFWFNGENILVKEGQFITGRKKLSFELGISESKIERILKFFEKTEQQIEQQKTNKNRMITILRWKNYQGSEQQNKQPVNNKRTTSEQQVDTNKNDKKEKNVNNEKNLNTYIEKWNKFLEPKVSTLTKDRKIKLRVRLNEKGFLNNYDKIIGIIKDTPFLRGDNNKNWQADFDWIIKNDTNYIKILEGKYRKPASQQKEYKPDYLTHELGSQR